MAPVKKSPHDRSKTFLRAWRLSRDMTQEEVAEKVEVNFTTIGRLERGEIPYNQDILEKLALIYGCDASDFLENDPLKPSPPKLIINNIRKAPPDLQRQILAVVETMLKAG